MNIKGLLVLSIVLSIFLVACTQAPSAQAPSTSAPGAPAASQSTGASAKTGGEVAAPVAPEAKFKITKQTALRSPSRVVFTLENVGNIDSSIELSVSLVAGGKAVETKDTTESLKQGESKEVVVEFPEVNSFISYWIEGQALVNPVKPAGS
jgi:hypothetical protein